MRYYKNYNEALEATRQGDICVQIIPESDTDYVYVVGIKENVMGSPDLDIIEVLVDYEVNTELITSLGLRNRIRDYGYLDTDNPMNEESIQIIRDTKLGDIIRIRSWEPWKSYDQFKYVTESEYELAWKRRKQRKDRSHKQWLKSLAKKKQHKTTLSDFYRGLRKKAQKIVDKKGIDCNSIGWNKRQFEIALSGIGKKHEQPRFLIQRLLEEIS